MKLTISWIVLCGLFLIPMDAISSWNGPVEVISGPWGKGRDEFGLSHGDSRDYFPDNLMMLTDRRIVISDNKNNRLKVYTTNGELIKLIKPLPGIYFYPMQGGDILTFSWDKQSEVQRVGIFNIDQEKWKWLDMATSFSAFSYEAILNDNMIIIWDGKNGYSYSLEGQLQQIVATKPIDLGLEEKGLRQQDGTYSITIKYHDMTYQIKSPARPYSFLRHSIGNLYTVVSYSSGNMNRVYRYNQCGRIMGYLDLPLNNVRTEKVSVGPNEPPLERLVILAEYGMPEIAENGDVIVWRRNETNYSILKWIWVNDPNTPSGPDAPSGLTVTPATSGLYLTWTASPSDPGCVTGYEISRSTSTGGAGSSVGTTTPGKLPSTIPRRRRGRHTTTRSGLLQARSFRHIRAK